MRFSDIQSATRFGRIAYLHCTKESNNHQQKSIRTLNKSRKHVTVFREISINLYRQKNILNDNGEKSNFIHRNKFGWLYRKA